MGKTNYLAAEYSELGLHPRWLDEEHAQNAFDYVMKYCNARDYGLEPSTTHQNQKHTIRSASVARQWLQDRLSADGTVQIVYSKDSVCVLPAQEFLNHWDSIFCPGRDDAVILHNLTSTLVFYCHEEELEIGIRKA